MRSNKVLGLILVAVGLSLAVWALMARGRGSYSGGWELDIQPRPGSNVILVTLDTTRADHLGAYGGRAGVTPNLDAMAASGMVLEQAQAVAPITLPSHASMLSGLLPTEHGIRNNGMFALPDHVETLPAVFAEAGYTTGAFVSAAVLTRRYGLNRDFDLYDDDLSKGLYLRYGSVPSRRGNLTLDAALSWLDNLPQGKPFFAWIHFYDPHAPYDPPPEFRKRYPNDPYIGEIAFTDSLVGRLLEHLDERGLAGTTYVSVIADHGEALGEHGEATHALLLHQATIHVPWILSGPGLPEGVRLRAPVSGIDVAPTLAILAGLRPPNASASHARPVFAHRAAPGAEETDRALYYETLLPKYQYGWKELHGVRIGSMELIRGTRDEVFDLKRDPRELLDVADRRPEYRELLGQAMAPFLEAVREGTDGGDATIELTRGEMDQLQALGYLGATEIVRTESPDPRDLIDAHVNFEKARTFQGQGMYLEAVAALDRTLEEDPTNISALQMRANINLRLQRFDAAREDVARVMSIDPQGAGAYSQMAQIELSRGNFSEALELARIGAGKRGAFEELSVLQTRALVGLGRMAEAEQLIVDRLQAKPDDPDLLSTRARFLDSAGKTDEAEALLRHAVAVDALHVQSRFALAGLLQRFGRTDEAVAILEELLQIQPGNPRVLAAIGSVKADDAEDARVYLEEAVRLDPSNGIAIVTLGQTYLRLDQPDKAEAMLRRGLELIPDRLPVRNNLAVSLLMQNKLDAAEAELRDVLRLNPGFSEARNNLALVLSRQGRFDEAEREARQAIREAPQLTNARITLAEILLETGRDREVVALLEPTYANGDRTPQLVRLLGIATSNSGDHSAAIPLLESAVASSEFDGPALLALARSLEAEGRADAARRMFERAAQLLPPGEDRQAALDGIQRLVLGSGGRP